jgi:hypothetical protein
MKIFGQVFPFLLFLLFVGTARGQEPMPSGKSAEKHAVVPKEPVLAEFVLSGDPIVTAQPVQNGFLGPMRCYYGKIYLRPIPPDTSPLVAPLVGLSLDGKSKVQSDLRTMPEFSAHQFVSPIYTVDKSGNGYFFVRSVASNPKDQSHEKTYIVKFSRDGTYSSTTELDRTLWAYSFAVFPSGNMMIAGLDRAPYAQEPESRARSMTGIFDSEGRLKYELKAPQKETMNAATAKLFNREAVDPAVEFGDAVIGPDDLLYLLKGGPEPRIEVWSEAGQKLRELKLTPPFKNAKTDAFLLVAEGTIAVGFEGPIDKKPKDRSVVWAVYDSYTGNPRRFYNNSILGQMICLEEGRFTFLVVKSGNYAFQEVDPQ